MNIEEKNLNEGESPQLNIGAVMHWHGLLTDNLN